MKTSISVLILLVMMISLSCCVSEEDVKASNELLTKFEQLRPGDNFYLSDWDKTENSKYLTVETKQKSLGGITYRMCFTHYEKDHINSIADVWLIHTDLDNRIVSIEKE